MCLYESKMPTEHAQMHAGKCGKVRKLGTLRGKGKWNNGAKLNINKLN